MEILIIILYRSESTVFLLQMKNISKKNNTKSLNSPICIYSKPSIICVVICLISILINFIISYKLHSWKKYTPHSETLVIHKAITVNLYSVVFISGGGGGGTVHFHVHQFEAIHIYEHDLPSQLHVRLSLSALIVIYFIISEIEFFLSL